jgi:concentrative nucleoside transporter, CNT family
LLFHWGIIQKVVHAINYVIRPLLSTSGAETLCAVANSFLGQTEAPLLVRNYLKDMTKSEMLVVMVSGMATISGSILVVFAAMGVPAQHMLAASVMAIPASIMIAKILLPETEKTSTLEHLAADKQDTKNNALGAIATGTSDGLNLAINVAAMLIAFLALLALVNHLLSFGADSVNSLLCTIGLGECLPKGLSIELIFSYLFAPFGYLLGFTGNTALEAGQLIGTKVAVNELIAYGQMVKMNLSERTSDILTYALCGFSNFSCIGIQIGGIGALVPEKRAWLTQLGLYAVLGGALSNLLSAMIAGLLL